MYTALMTTHLYKQVVNFLLLKSSVLADLFSRVKFFIGISFCEEERVGSCYDLYNIIEYFEFFRLNLGFFRVFSIQVGNVSRCL